MKSVAESIERIESYLNREVFGSENGIEMEGQVIRLFIAYDSLVDRETPAREGLDKLCKELKL